MRKTNLLIVLLVVSVIALVGVLTACKDTVIENDNQIVEKDFLESAKAISKSELNITVTQGDDLVYELDTANNIDNDVHGLGYSKANYSGTATGLSYSASDFKNGEISKQAAISTYTYTAEIANPNEFLNIGSGTASNATINIIISSDKELRSVQINYTHTALEIEYKVTIILTPVE